MEGSVGSSLQECPVHAWSHNLLRNPARPLHDEGSTRERRGVLALQDLHLFLLGAQLPRNLLRLLHGGAFCAKRVRLLLPADLPSTCVPNRWLDLHPEVPADPNGRPAGATEVRCLKVLR